MKSATPPDEPSHHVLRYIKREKKKKKKDIPAILGLFWSSEVQKYRYIDIYLYFLGGECYLDRRTREVGLLSQTKASIVSGMLRYTPMSASYE